MDRLDVSTVIYAPHREVYEFVTDFPRYARYSRYLDRVRQLGDGGAGTRYELHFAWWKLNYTARSEVIDVVPPDRVDWELVRDITAEGAWTVEPTPEEAPADVSTATRARLQVDFDPNSARGGAIDIPRFVSFDWVLRKAKPVVVEEAKRVVGGMVADIEGEPRPVELTVHASPTV